MSFQSAAVTGASGHLGNVLVRQLLDRGVKVRAVVEPRDEGISLSGLPVERVPGDVMDPLSLVRAFDGVDVVFHLAGIVSITVGQEPRLFEVNVRGTRNVVTACQDRKVRRLVHVGSVHALDEPKHGLLDEKAGFDPTRAHGAYAKSKAQACWEVQRAALDGELDAVVVLPTGVIGPWDFRLSEMGQLLVSLSEGRVPLLMKGGYDWVDVRDVADGMIRAAERGRSGESYLLGGEWRSLTDVAKVVADISGMRVPPAMPAWLGKVIAAPAPAWEFVSGRRALVTPYAVRTLTSPWRVTIAKAREELGYAPRATTVAIADTLTWHLTNPLSPRNRRLRVPGPARRLVPAR